MQSKATPAFLLSVTCKICSFFLFFFSHYFHTHFIGRYSRFIRQLLESVPHLPVVWAISANLSVHQACGVDDCRQGLASSRVYNLYTGATALSAIPRFRLCCFMCVSWRLGGLATEAWRRGFPRNQQEIGNLLSIVFRSDASLPYLGLGRV